MATVKLVLKTNKTKKDGRSPIYLRLTKSRKSKFISLGYYVNPEDWDSIKGKVKRTHPNSVRLNAFLSQKIAEAENQALNLETKSKVVTTAIIKEAVLGKPGNDLFKFMGTCIARYKSKNQISVFKRGNVILHKLQDFRKSSSLTFEEVTHSFLKDFETFLATEKGNSANTIKCNFKYLSTIFNNAIKEGLTTTQPFRIVKIQGQPAERDYLTEEEIVAIENLQLNESSMMNHHRNMYVFSCYCGLRISDVLKLTWANYDGKSINIRIHKTKSQLSIFIPQKAAEILNFYRKPGVKLIDFIFPILTQDDFQSPVTLFDAISSATAYVNKDLKAIAKLAGIEKKIGFHSSRHSFSVRALRKGMRIEYLSKILGHKNIRETQIYAKIVNSDLEKAMEVFNEDNQNVCKPI